MQGLAIFSLHSLEVGPHYIVGLAGGDTLGEFAGVIGIDLPFGFLIGQAADLNPYAIDGVIVGIPDGAENEGIGIGRLQLLGSERRIYARQGVWAQRSEEEKK